ncbi:MAG: GAF domain-containing sensor histidine kinase [Chloroflexi bacterium]|nr:GAF domain-containing sensor histidine kinase [Chloroflexota bacterium]
MRLIDDITGIQTMTEAAKSVLQGLSLPDTLQRIAEIVREMVGARYAAVGVPSEDGTGLRAFITSGMHPDDTTKIEHEPVGRGLLGALLESDEAIRLNNIQEDARSSGFCDNHPEMTTFLGVPAIGRNHQRLGNLYLCDRIDGEPFDEVDERIVVLFASFAAIAIENAKLHQRLQASALRNERDRIGMELHDGVIQDIYAVGMKLEIMRGGSDMSPKAEHHFNDIAKDLNNIIESIRHYIRDLSSADKAQASTFQQQVENLILHFRDFSGIDVELIVPETLPPLTDNQRHSLSQIVREALANIARHSEASKAEVTIRYENQQLHLAIHDNGKGMDPDQMHAEDHFGLRNMEQRARRLRGFLDYNSAPGQGTTIEVVVPVKQSGVLQS